MPSNHDDELEREIQAHLELEAEQHEASGASKAEAMSAARRAFGNVTRTKESVRAIGTWTWWEGLRRDLMFAARGLRRSTRFTVATVITLGTGIAIVATMLMLLNAYLIRSLPYPNVDRLHHVVYAPPGQREPSGLTEMDWRSLSDVVDLADNSLGVRFYLRNSDAIEELSGLLIAPGALDVLDVHAFRGRSFVAGDFDPNAEPAALLGHSVWQNRYGADPDIVGRLLRLGIGEGTDQARPFRIVGVLPPEFRWAREYARDPLDIVAPLRGPSRVYMVRLREGVTASAAAHRITEVARVLAGSSAGAGWRVQLEPLHERYVATLRPILVAVTLAAGLVLAIVIANVAILTLLRAMRRQREITIRLALGAGRYHLARLYLAESVVICAAALTLGVACAAVVLPRLAPVIEAQLGRPVPGGVAALAFDFGLLLAFGGGGVAIALTVGLVPLLARGPSRLMEGLRSGGRTATEYPSVRWIRSGLIVVEVAGSLALLVGCGLMVRSAINLVATDLGMQTDGVVRSRLALPTERYSTPAAVVAFYQQLTEQFGTRENGALALINYPPLFQAALRSIQRLDDDSHIARAHVMAVSPEYFSVLRIGLIEGRPLNDGDRAGAEAVVVISDSAARSLWPTDRALGREIQIVDQSSAGPRPGRPRRVVGVVKDVRQTFRDTDLNDVYQPLYQDPSRFAQILIRSDGPSRDSRDALARLADAIDRNALVGAPSALKEEANELLERPRFLASMLTGFAAFAAVLALIGIYGVTAYATEQRESEVAIRSALGATQREITGMLLRAGTMVIAGGVGVGLLGAVALSGALRQQLHGVPPTDVAMLFSAAGAIGLSGFVAMWWPVRALASKSPATVLNRE